MEKKTKHKEEKNKKKNKSKLITSKSSSVSNLSADWDRAAELSVAYGMGKRGAKERGKQTDDGGTDGEARNLQSVNKNNRGSS